VKIDEFLSNNDSGFWDFYNWFQDSYFGDRNEKFRKSLSPNEVSFMEGINDLLAYAGPHPTQDERKNGIMDADQFRQNLAALKQENISIWRQYTME
jgi:hypothetical protein